MPSTLVLLSVYLNQMANYSLIYQYPIIWDIRQRKWKHLGSNKPIPNNVARYYKLIIILLFLFAVPASQLIILHAIVVGRNSPIKLHHVMIHSLFGLNVLLSLFYDMLLYRYGNDLVNFANWINRLEFRSEYTFNKLPDFDIFSTTFLQILNKEIINALRRQDFLGIALFGLVASYTNSSYTAPLLLVAVNWDHLYLICKVVTEKQNNVCENNISLFVCRIIFCFVGSQLVFTNLRTFTMIGLNLCSSFLSLLKRMSFLQMTRYNCLLLTRIYREFCVALASAEDLVRSVLQVYLSCTCFILISGANGTITGVRTQNMFVLCSALIVNVVVLVVLIFCFNSGCRLENMTYDLVYCKWKQQISGIKSDGFQFKSKYIKATLKSYRKCTFKIGNTSLKLDKKIKIHYLDSVLGYAATVQLMIRNFSKKV